MGLEFRVLGVLYIGRVKEQGRERQRKTEIEREGEKQKKREANRTT